jgi:integrase/recombinase XerD
MAKPGSGPRPLTLVPPPSPWDTWIGDYLDEKRAGGVSRHTIAIYEYSLRKVLLPYCEAREIAEPRQLTAAHLNSLVAGLLDGTGSRSGRPLAKDSVDSYARTINTFLAWLQGQGTEITKARAQRQKLSRRVLETLSREEIQKLEDAAETERDKLIIRILADTGIRVGELLGLTKDPMRLDGRRHYLKVLGKGDQERLVPLQPGLAARIARFAKGTRKESASQHLFLSSRRHRRSGEYEALTKSGVEQWLSELGRDVLGESRRIYPHLFRHSFVTEQLRRGMQPILVAKIVGHSSLEMVDRVYQHLSVSDAHEALMRSLAAEDR